MALVHYSDVQIIYTSIRCSNVDGDDEHVSVSQIITLVMY